MTIEQQTPQVAPNVPNDEPAVITPQAGSRLAQLLEQHEIAYAQAAAAKERLEALTEAIKTEAYAAEPGRAKYRIAGSAHWPAMVLSWIADGWRVDSKRLKDQDPVTYVRYAVPVKPHWTLRRSP